MTNKIHDPNVHLFAFDLHDSSIITINSGKTNSGRPNIYISWLWKICDNIISSALQKNSFHLINYLDLAKKPTSFRVALRDADKIKIFSRHKKTTDFYISEAVPIAEQVPIDSQQTIAVKGFVYPVRIYNSFGLWLNLGFSKQEAESVLDEVDIQSLRHLNPNNLFLAPNNRGVFGQTIIITARLTANDLRKSNKELTEIADECLKAFFPENYNKPPLNRTGDLFGSPIFQYGTERDLPSSGSIFVSLFRGRTTYNKFYESRYKLFDLFFHRSQIITAFQKTTQVSKSLKSVYKQIVSDVNNLRRLGNNKVLTEDDLNKFQNKLKKLPALAKKYEEVLARMSNYKHKIDNNIKKYNNLMEEICVPFQNEDVCFLKAFSDENCPFYQEEIEAYIRYFQDGSSLIDKALASIRGQLAIEQAEQETRRQKKQEESDRNLQVTILAVSSIFGAGGIVSQIIGNKISSFSTDKYVQMIEGILISLSVGIIIGLFFTIIIYGNSWIRQAVTENWILKYFFPKQRLWILKRFLLKQKRWMLKLFFSKQRQSKKLE
ncbi:MAG: hypothetical protein KME60_13245 [Cyanomargarita calcarea GSE-NOS-MK-12-04C]|jgi:hypothetical protein|uniref:Uncharacterized protein n=1 Tax=Cyanomargarita calcarea GSE-NOS-MK-12-04C TaxID=2839659 RepID=A0A951QMS9_9CYAN|nr:hypothetical protein [Cyanomargarita calcarea GSE-NOS-MK-12-04C]